MNDNVFRFLENRIDLLKHKDKDTDKSRRTSSEVFDESTLKILYKLISDGELDTLEFCINTGKEANIFRGTSKKGFVAVKIYRVSNATFKNFGMYLQGDPRFKHLSHDHRALISMWARKEYKNLLRLKEAGVRVPAPLAVTGNVLLMEYIGTRDEAAPMLRDARLGPRGLERVAREIINFIDLAYNRANLVHGDLSEYNILMNGKETVLIDVAQSVLREHPMAGELLVRDIKNISFYFKRHGTEMDSEVVHSQVVSHKDSSARRKEHEEE